MIDVRSGLRRRSLRSSEQNRNLYDPLDSYEQFVGVMCRPQELFDTRLYLRAFFGGSDGRRLPDEIILEMMGSLAPDCVHAAVGIPIAPRWVCGLTICVSSHVRLVLVCIREDLMTEV